MAINPQATFERMFGDPGTPEQRIARLQAKQSMLDSVLGETKRLQKMIGASDNKILDEYLTNVRRVEEPVFLRPPMTPLSESLRISTST